MAAVPKGAWWAFFLLELQLFGVKRNRQLLIISKDLLPLFGK